MHLQADGFLFDALHPILARHGILQADPRLPYLKAKPASRPAIWAYRIFVVTFVAFIAALFGALLYVYFFLRL
jgi:hypothetical protein